MGEPVRRGDVELPLTTIPILGLACEEAYTLSHQIQLPYQFLLYLYQILY